MKSGIIIDHDWRLRSYIFLFCLLIHLLPMFVVAQPPQPALDVLKVFEKFNLVINKVELQRLIKESTLPAEEPSKIEDSLPTIVIDRFVKIRNLLGPGYQNLGLKSCDDCQPTYDGKSVIIPLQLHSQILKWVKSEEKAIDILDFIIAHEISHMVFNGSIMKISNVFTSKTGKTIRFQMHSSTNLANPETDPSFLALSESDRQKIQLEFFIESTWTHAIVDLIAMEILEPLGKTRDAGIAALDFIWYSVAKDIPNEVPLALHTRIEMAKIQISYFRQWLILNSNTATGI